MNASARKHVDGLHRENVRSAQATASSGTPVAGNRRAALVIANGGALSVLVVAAAAFALVQTHESSGRETWPWGEIGLAFVALFAGVGAFGWVTLRLMGGALADDGPGVRSRRGDRAGDHPPVRADGALLAASPHQHPRRT